MTACYCPGTAHTLDCWWFTPEAGAYQALAKRVMEVTEERDRARALAVALEQQAATLTAALNVALHYATRPDAEPDREALEGCAVALQIAVEAQP